VPPGPETVPAPGTGDHWSLPGAAEYRPADVQPAAHAPPVPVHRAQTANTRRPAVSSASTRSPPVLTWLQAWPPSWVAHRPGPNAHPSVPSRNRSWLTPADPSGAPVTGALTPCQLRPPSPVPASDVQMSGFGPLHWPGVPAWPST
jgi:hypothetical protein